MSHWNPFHIINNLFKKENIDDGKLMTKIIYNTRTNLMVLVSYSHDYFYSMIEFIQAVNQIPHMKIYLSHSAKEKEYTEDELKEFDKKKVDIIDNRYYALISGTPEDYCALYGKIYTLSNEILNMLTQDFYNNCSSTYFNEMINYGILDFGKFKYQNIVPHNYDKHISFKLNDSPRGEMFYADNIELILSRLPETFSAIDICPCIYIYLSGQDKNDLEFLCNIPKLISKASEVYNGAQQTRETQYYEAIAKTTKNIIFKHIVPEPSIEVLSIVNAPLFLRENIEDEINGNMSIEDMDEIFQQEYDRFNNITADNNIEYEDIDEQIGENEETENMRKEDILNDSE